MTKKMKLFAKFIEEYEMVRPIEIEKQTIKELGEYRDKNYKWNSGGWKFINTIINYMEENLQVEKELSK